MTKEQWMQKTIELAYENTVNGGKPFGAIIVKDDAIVAVGVNEVLETHDPTAHAELLAIRRSTEKLQTTDLSDCQLYASGEPCPMCMGAIYWANFKDVYYAYSSEEEEQAGLGTSHVYAQLALPREEREIQLQHVERQAETNDAFALWIEKQQ